MPIRDHPEAFSTIPCETVRYGVLVGVSTGYPPVAGRLHTRYAPVRRSPAVYCYTPLPLDLHVLGLPLAFILSQDQTLHCKNCLLLPFDSSSCLRTRATPDASDTRYLIFPIRFNVLALPLQGRPLRRVSLSKAGAKIRPFSKPPKFFFVFFPDFSSHRCPTAVWNRDFFSFSSPTGQKRPRKTPRGDPFFPKIGLPPHGFFRISLQLAGYLSFNAFRGWAASFLHAVAQRVAGHSRAGRAAPPPLLPRPSSARCPPVVPHLFLICSFFIGQMVRQRGKEWTAGSGPAPLREGHKKISGAGPMAPLRENRKT